MCSKSALATLATIMTLTTPILGASRADASGVRLDLEPIVGYERVQKLRPTEHTKDRLFYGARLSLGIPLLALESELTRSNDSEVFTNLTTRDTTDKLKLGLRSTLRLGRLLSVTGRGGVQARKNKHEETSAGVTTITTDPKPTYKPYAGGGLRVSLSPKTAITGAVTVVFNEFPKMAKNEYQTSLGFSVSLP